MLERSKCFIFCLVFCILSLGMGACGNKKSASIDDDKKVTNNVVKLEGFSEIKLPDSIEVRNDIPFSLLLDKELKKNIPDTVDVDIYKPDYIILKKGFNENDSLQLAVFPNITISTISSNDGSSLALGDEMIEGLINRILMNIAATPYIISEWKKLDTSFVLPDGSPGLVLKYVQKQKDTDQRTNITNLFILKNGKLINILMSAPDSRDEEWNGYFDKIINSIIPEEKVNLPVIDKK